MGHGDLARWRSFSPVLVPILVATLLVGCLSTETLVHEGDGTRKGAAIRVAVFPNPDAVEAKALAPDGTLIEIFRLVDRKEVFLQRSLASRWGIDGLPPGEYRLKVVAALDDRGNITDVRAGDRVTDMTIGEGDVAEVQVVLKKTPVGLIVVAALTVVVLVVALVFIAADGDIDLPTPPDPSALLENLPSPPLDHVVFYPDLIDAFVPLGGDGADVPDDYEVPPPRVTSLFPRPSSRVSARRASPAVTFSQEISLDSITPQTIRMLGSKSGLVPGRTEVKNGLLRFVPTRDFLAGEVVTVTIRGEEIENLDGEPLGPDYSWSFRVATAK